MLDQRILTKAAALRQLLTSPKLEFFMEAHNGMSARIVEQVGFRAIWASGLTISSAFGVRDRNEASWTQVLEVVNFMSDRTEIPILLDGDTGYGDFNNFARIVRKLDQIEVAGVCIEDKIFPKQNSFLGQSQELTSIEDFVSKIRAGKESQRDPNFSIVARTETLIAGRSMQEALDRAAAYHEAGADAILIHSKKADSTEIEEFCRQWNNLCPVVLVPTKYYTTPADRFRALNVSAVIWANHTMRAAITAMEAVCRRVHAEESLSGVESEIASLACLFELTGEADYAAFAERFSASGSLA